jgi:hypothetical protein
LACEQFFQRLCILLRAGIEQQLKRMGLLHASLKQQFQWRLLLAGKRLQQRLGLLGCEQLLQRLALGSEETSSGHRARLQVRIRGD